MLTLILRLQFPLLLALATYLSLTPQPGEVFASYSDKFLHVLCWGGLYGSLRLALLGREHWVISAISLLIYASLVEFLQNLSPEREFSILDMGANALGISLALLFCYFAQALYLRALTSKNETH
jgi:VanZ family protein